MFKVSQINGINSEIQLELDVMHRLISIKCNGMVIEHGFSSATDLEQFLYSCVTAYEKNLNGDTIGK